ncbi:hypothetical protein [Streptomyces scabiei]|uniref:hypothetical protein n=1 Tax=Streptomyces scabiei TaxID=1930 RepID=UPI0029B6442B|nr:hypothetical protein [Streptomyces scabiei]MDX3520741.1 hypothetical protein [Streptomyces scabiei]
MTDRVPLDHLTSDALDDLYEQLEALRAVARGYCPDCGRGDAAPTVADWETQRRRADTAEWRHKDAERRVRCQRERAETAEAAVDRVRALHQPAECVNVRCKLKQWCIGCDPHGIEGCDENPWPCPTITALDQPGPAATQATEPECTCGGPASTTTLPSGIAYEEHRRDCTVMTTGEPDDTDTPEAACDGCGHSEDEGCGCPPTPAGLRARIAHTLRTTPNRHATTQLGFPDHHGPSEGYLGWCALCTRDIDALTEALLAAVTEHLDIGEEQAWCRYCRRAWDSPAHRCESDAERRVQRLADLRDQWLMAGAPPLGTSINRWVDKRLVEFNAALDGEPPGPA